MKPFSEAKRKATVIIAVVALVTAGVFAVGPGKTLAAPADKVVTLECGTGVSPSLHIEKGVARTLSVSYLSDALSSNTGVATVTFKTGVDGEVYVTGARAGVASVVYGNIEGKVGALEIQITDSDNISGYTLKEGGIMSFSESEGQSQQTRPSPVVNTVGLFNRIIWSSMNTAVATVASNGAITARGTGATVILGEFTDKWGTPRVLHVLVGVGIPDSGEPEPVEGVFVSPTGNDATADGSVDAPYKSINTALAAAQPGDTVFLRGGTYQEGQNVRIRKPNITIKSYPGEWAVIDLLAGNGDDSGVYFDVDSSGGELLNVEVMGGYYAVCMETKWLWGGDDDWVAATDILIEGCVLHDSQYDVVKVKPNCDSVTIRNNEIYNSGRALLDDPGWDSGEVNAEGIDNVNGDDMLVQNNYIHDIGGNGIYAKGGADDALIQNNRIERTQGAGIMVGFDTSPEFFDIVANPAYYENIRGVVQNNLIIDTGWEGIGFYGSEDAHVYNNTLVNVDRGGLFHSAIYFGLTYQDWEPHKGRPPSVNPNIHHNIVSQPASFNRQMIEIRYASDLGGMSALSGDPEMNHNCYYIAGKSASFTDWRPGSLLENAGLSAWQAHISGDNGSIEVNPGLDSEYMPTNPLCDGMGWDKDFSA